MSGAEKETAYLGAINRLEVLLEDETHPIAKMATINCVLREALPYYFWTGFYLREGDQLVIGPYQGTLGCLRIAWGRGVCGTAARTGKTQVVPDVHEFPGHIACDSRSQSEIVVPVFDPAGNLIAVFDVDSTEKASFDGTDQFYLEGLMRKYFQRL